MESRWTARRIDRTAGLVPVYGVYSPTGQLAGIYEQQADAEEIAETHNTPGTQPAPDAESLRAARSAKYIR